MAKWVTTERVKDWVENWRKKVKYYHPHSKAKNIPVSELYDLLEQMPPEVVKIEIHANWKIDLTTMKAECTACGFTCPSYLTYVFKYCPDCGAKIDWKGSESF